MKTGFQRLRLATALPLVITLAVCVGASVAAEQTAPPVVPVRPVTPPLGPPPARASLITTPSWQRSPMPEYPQAAAAAGVESGDVTLRCTIMPTGWLTDCEAVKETPEGHGFAESALASTARARLSPRTVDSAVEGAKVVFTIRYRAPA